MCPTVETTSQEAQELGDKGRHQTQLAQMGLLKVKLDGDEADFVREEAVCVVVVEEEDVVALEMVMLLRLLLHQLLPLPLPEQHVCKGLSLRRVFYELQ